jgi:hypothetical protein
MHIITNINKNLWIGDFTFGEIKLVVMIHKIKNKGISLFIGVLWLICGFVLTFLEPENLFFSLFLGIGIFFTTYKLPKNQKLL